MRYVVILLLFAGIGFVPVADLAPSSTLSRSSVQNGENARQDMTELRCVYPETEEEGGSCDAGRRITRSTRIGVVPEFELAIGSEIDPDGRC